MARTNGRKREGERERERALFSRLGLDNPIEAYYYFSACCLCVLQIASRIILSRRSYTAAAAAEVESRFWLSLSLLFSGAGAGAGNSCAEE